MAFATYYDVEARWGRTLTTEEQQRATALLDDAAAILHSLVKVDGTNDDQASLLAAVSCNMVIRSMTAAAQNAFGVEAQQATMGPFAQRVEYANPSGDMYLTKAEKKWLGIHGGAGRILYPYETGDDDA